MNKTDYAQAYRNIDFRAHPELYVIGRGEQGVLIAEPYKSEILPHWKFATPADAKTSAQKIYGLFEGYKQQQDFVGMDMARKFLQMGFTRARRYANHASGTKYDAEGKVIAQAKDWQNSPKAQSAAIFKDYYDQARTNPDYIRARQAHRVLQDTPKRAK